MKVVSGLATLAVLLAASAASAQTLPAVTGIVGDVVRLEPGGINADGPSGTHPHPGGVPRNVVNFDDCQANVSYEFQLLLSGVPTSSSLVAYVGPVDCTPLAARVGASASCWPLTASPVSTDNPPATVFVRTQDLAQAAASATAPASYSAATQAACNAQQAPDARGLAIYFFFVDGANDAIGVAQAYPVVVDTRAEDIGSYSVAPLNAQVEISISAASDADTVGWNIYCDPPPGQETAINQVTYDAATNGGQCPDSGGDASASTTDDAGGSTCGVATNVVGPGLGGCSPSSVLVSGGGTTTWTLVEAGTNEAGQPVLIEAGTVTGGTQATIPSKYLCATASADQTQVTVTGLLNGYSYQFAVAAVDSAGNTGPLAVGQCQAPTATADFFGSYALGGGQAGGGFCSTEGAGLPAGTTGLGLLTVASVAALVRKRRRASR